MSTQQLADKAAGLGMPIPRSVLANLESGRRAAVSAAELLVLGSALDVPPGLLLFPVGHADAMEPLPGVELVPWDAFRWFVGERELTVFSDGPGAGYAVVMGPPGHAEIMMYREHETATRARNREWSYLQRALIAASEARTDGEAVAQRRVADELRDRLIAEENRIRALRQAMRDKGIGPPPLPGELAHIDTGGET